MNLSDIQSIATALAPVLRDLVKQNVDALRVEFQKDIADFKTQLEDMRCKDIPETVERIKSDVLSTIKIPEPIKGEKGDPGETGPAGKDGVDGKDGRDGKDGVDGKDGSNGAKGETGPAGPAGEKGMDGAPGPMGPQGKEGPAGRDGNSPSPEAIALLFEPRFSELCLSIERRATDAIIKAIANLPKPENGKDGRDAVQLDQYDVRMADDERTMLLSYNAGDIKKEFALRLPFPIDRGVYRESGLENGMQYMKGDSVSYGGSMFTAQVDCPKGVPGSSKDWRLSVKRGRDGADLRENASRHDPSKGLKV